MKNLVKYFTMLMMVLSIGMTVTSCGDDDDEPTPPDPQSLADRVKGTYSGKLTSGSNVLEDAYIVKITKQTDNTVTVEAKFFGDDGGMNFNLSESNGIINFSNSGLSNLTMYMTSGTLIITYKANSGNMLTYTGTR